MSKLFIIGNGFDVAHGLPTKYSNFKFYLKEKYKIEDKVYLLPDRYMEPNGGEELDEEDCGKFLYNFINKSMYGCRCCLECTRDCYDCEWNQFEEALGKLKFDYIFNEASLFEFDYDKDGDLDDWSNAYKRENIANNIELASQNIYNFFNDWIKTINIREATYKEHFNELIEEDSIFINFNYTSTLEDIYDAEKVFHIHGFFDGDENIIVGHGLEQKQMDELHDKYMGNFTGAEDALYNIIKFFKKNTDEIIEGNITFFESLTDVTEIYSFGFSFSDVDLPYIRKICDSIDTEKVVWYQHKFSLDRGEDRSVTLKSCGFKGSFSVFDC